MPTTAYFAEAPGAPPNFILPYASGAYFSVANLTQFIELMYRPLYWFGQTNSSQATYNSTLSTADFPVASDGGKTITIKMKGWKWSNGQTVDAQDVMFWINMQKAEPLEYGGTVPGLFPYNVKSYSASAAADTVTLHLSQSYGATWFLYNELSQITPMPTTWDITKAGAAAGSGGCSSMNPSKATMTACKAVWTFLTDDAGQAKNPSEAADPSTYATNPLWKVVDGPWKLQTFTSSSEATFVPNPDYALFKDGMVKTHITKFVELPFTTDTAEYNALTAGGSGAPDVGYIPTQNVPAYTGSPGGVGSNASLLSGKYNLVPVYGWGINYFPYNFNSTGDNGQAGYIFQQLYIRQAIQSLVDQNTIIQHVDKGYAVPDYGPAPTEPKNPYTGKSEYTNPYPFNVAKAKQLLTAHGWTVVKNGTSTCAVPAKCGANIVKGAQLNFSMIYASGSQALTQTVAEEVSDWAQVGIHVTTKAETFDNLFGTVEACTRSQGATCNWEMGDWGGGWIFAPDYLPTGEDLFATGASSNYGSYSDSKADTLIKATEGNPTATSMAAFESYLEQQLPVVWQPDAVSSLGEVATNLKGVTPVNALLNLTPEYWQFTS